MKTRDQIRSTEPTRYEVALVRGETVLHSYGCTARKSKQGILAMLDADVDHLLTEEEIEESNSLDLKYTKKYGFKVATNVYIRFTGQTERELASAKSYKKGVDNATKMGFVPN